MSHLAGFKPASPGYRSWVFYKLNHEYNFIELNIILRIIIQSMYRPYAILLIVQSA